MRSRGVGDRRRGRCPVGEPTPLVGEGESEGRRGLQRCGRGEVGRVRGARVERRRRVEKPRRAHPREAARALVIVEVVPGAIVDRREPDRLRRRRARVEGEPVVPRAALGVADEGPGAHGSPPRPELLLEHADVIAVRRQIQMRLAFERKQQTRVRVTVLRTRPPVELNERGVDGAPGDERAGPAGAAVVA